MSYDNQKQTYKTHLDTKISIFIGQKMEGETTGSEKVRKVVSAGHRQADTPVIDARKACVIA